MGKRRASSPGADAPSTAVGWHLNRVLQWPERHWNPHQQYSHAACGMRHTLGSTAATAREASQPASRRGDAPRNGGGRPGGAGRTLTTMHSPRPAANPRPLTIAQVPTSPGRRGGSATHAESSHMQYWRMRRSLRSIPPGDDAAEVCVQRAERRGRTQIGREGRGGEGRATDMIGSEPRQCSRGQWVCAHGPVSRTQAA